MYNVTKINTTRRFQESPIQFSFGLTIDTIKHEHSGNSTDFALWNIFLSNLHVHYGHELVILVKIVQFHYEKK